MSSIFAHVSAPAPRYLLRLAILARLFRKYIRGENKHFLEIGPGRGDVSAYLATLPAIGGGLVIDLSEKSAALVSARLCEHPGIDIACADVRDIDARQFDYVMSFEVLEHIEQDEDFMRDVHRRVVLGGYWFISVPAYMRKWQRQDEFSGHVRRYEADEITQKLVAAGFDVIELIDYGFPLTLLMRPFRDRFYRPDPMRSDLEKTLASGTEDRIFDHSKSWPLLVLLGPFFVLQRLFAWLRQGDGFIVVAVNGGGNVKRD